MDYEQAIESTVSIRDAIRELDQHGITAIAIDNWIVCQFSDERIAKINNGEVRGEDVLAWLGY